MTSDRDARIGTGAEAVTETQDFSEEAFARWWAELKAEAERQEAPWLAGAVADEHRAAFQAGRSPVDEVRELLDIGEWRGCGCGGG